jgi:hypothetical protein
MKPVQKKVNTQQAIEVTENNMIINQAAME